MQLNRASTLVGIVDTQDDLLRTEAKCERVEGRVRILEDFPSKVQRGNEQDTITDNI
jgi:hypothetical protein